jgi:DNA gyrase inhibitor GyrI
MIPPKSHMKADMTGTFMRSHGRSFAFGVTLVLASFLTGGCSAPDSVKVVETVTGPYTFAYLEYVGDYSNTAPVFAELRQALSQQGIVPNRSIGIYLDDPRKVPATALRCICGAIIKESDQRKLEKLRGQFKIEHIGRGKRLVAEYRLSGHSPSEESSKCYAALSDYAREKGYMPLGGFELYEADRAIACDANRFFVRTRRSGAPGSTVVSLTPARQHFVKAW